MPQSLIQMVWFAIGLTALYFGAEWLVRGAGRLAREWGVSAMIVGLTVVAFGTSAPELVVGVIASVRGQPELALGNVVGSNVMNIALILGISAVLTPIGVAAGVIRREIPVMILITLAAAALALNGVMATGDGVVLLLLFAGYFAVVFRGVRRGEPEVELEYEEFGHPSPAPAGRQGAGRNVALIVIGALTMVAGAHLMVEAAVFFALVLGLSELAIGLTIVSIGTSLPELATSLVAAWRKKSDIAVGNIVGSNVFNLCMILGVAALIAPITVERSVLMIEFLIMVVISIALLPLALTRNRLGRVEGGLLLALYAVFMLAVLNQAGMI